MSLGWPSAPEVAHPHREMILGLVMLAGWLTDHPELPLGEADLVVLRLQDGLINASDSQQIAYVREMARLLDVQEMWSWDRRHVTAERTFRGKVSIEAIACLPKGEPIPVPVAQAVAEPPVDVDEDQAVTVTQPAAIDEAAMPEVACGACLGTGEGPRGESCIYCLGKGRILAWQPRHAAGVAW